MFQLLLCVIRSQAKETTRANESHLGKIVRCNSCCGFMSSWKPAVPFHALLEQPGNRSERRGKRRRERRRRGRSRGRHASHSPKAVESKMHVLVRPGPLMA